MKISASDLKQLCEIAIKAAQQAGTVIIENRNCELMVKNKSGADSLASQVVTEVDLLAQETILKHILPSCKEFDLALLTEESPDDNSRFKKDYFWCIDPMDGTLPFIKSTPGFSVSIGLVSKNGESQIGVVYDPIEENLYHAIKGQGAFRNEVDWKPEAGNRRREVGEGKELTLVIDPGFSGHLWYEQTLEAFRTKHESIKIIELGGAVMNAMWVLENQPAVYFKFPKKRQGGGSLWDFAATACIYKEYGIFVGDFFQKELDLNRKDSLFMNEGGVIYASDEKLAQDIIEIYNQFYAEFQMLESL